MQRYEKGIVSNRNHTAVCSYSFFLFVRYFQSLRFFEEVLLYQIMSKRLTRL